MNDNDNGFSNSGQAFEADLDAITQDESETTEEEEEEEN